MDAHAGDAPHQLGTGGEHGRIGGHGGRQRLGAGGVDEDRAEPVASPERPFDHHVAFGQEPAGGVGPGPLAAQTQIVVAQPHEVGDPFVARVGDVDPEHTGVCLTGPTAPRSP